MFSIIMPCYNAAPYIAEAIKSCLYQTCGDFELIIVNDGSTDSSKKIINYFLSQSEKIRYFEKENGGPSSAMNYGIEQAKGEIILFVSADDIQLPNRLEVIKETFKNKIDFCYSGYNHANIKAQPWEYVSPKHLTYENIKNNVCMSGGAISGRKYVFDKIKFRDVKVNEDMGLALDLFKSKFKYAMIDVPLFNYRLLPTGMSYSRKKEVEEITKQIIKEIDEETKNTSIE